MAKQPLNTPSPGDLEMKWNTPVIVEVAVGMEINMYASAHRKQPSRSASNS
jgi:coenzyme PQQ precursor peptide PqqA